MRKRQCKTQKARLKLLETAEKLNNISQACRLFGVSRAQFYGYRKRFKKFGLDGLLIRPPVHKTHPFTTSKKNKEAIITYASKFPEKGCHSISKDFKKRWFKISGVTIQKILNARGLGTAALRLKAIEREHILKGSKLLRNQVRGIEAYNPAFKERDTRVQKPGELLCQDSICLGSLNHTARLYAQIIIDTYGNYAFAFLHINRDPVNSGYFLFRHVVRQYSQWGIKIKSILTDKDREYCKKESNYYKICLSVNGIRHFKRGKKCYKENGFLERFRVKFLKSFLRGAKANKLFKNIADCQIRLNQWLYEYNYKNPLDGYRNMGSTPFEMIKPYLTDKSNAADKLMIIYGENQLILHTDKLSRYLTLVGQLKYRKIV